MPPFQSLNIRLREFEMGNRLTLEPARLVALQNFATHSTLKETAAAVNLLPGLLAVYDATITGQAPEDALRLLSGLQNQLSQTLIPGKLKKRFLSYLQKLKNNNNDSRLSLSSCSRSFSFSLRPVSISFPTPSITTLPPSRRA